MVESVTCACGCGAVLTRRGKSGPRPKYASESCRVRAFRLRHRGLPAELEPLEDLVHANSVSLNSRPIEEQIQRGLLDARAIGFAFQRLGLQARPDLAWRCTRLGTAIITAIDESFKETT